MVVLSSLLSVSRSAYYAWIKAVDSQKAKEDNVLKTVITRAFTQNRAVYGTRRLKKALATQGYQASRRRIARLMKEKANGGLKRPQTQNTTYLLRLINWLASLT